MELVKDGQDFLLYLLLFGLIAFTEAGRYVYQTTTNDNKYYILNDLGVKVTQNSPLIMEVQTCQDGLLRFAETHDLQGNYYDVVLGAGANAWSGLRDRCGGCAIVTSHAGAILDCHSMVALWVTWDPGRITIGTGNDVDNDVILTYTDSAPFEIHYVAVASYYGVTGDWRVYIDEKPVFTLPLPDGSTVLAIPETVIAGEVILTMTAIDPENDKITFSILDSYFGKFEVDGTELEVSKSLDYEECSHYSLILSASDGYNEVNASLTVTVTDECDEPPEVSIGHVITAQEELPIGTVIGPWFTVTDSDVADVLTYDLTGVDAIHFYINSSTGEMTMAGRLDCDGGTSYLEEVYLEVTDSCNLTTSVHLNVTIINVNDHAPQFVSCPIHANISENSTTNTLLSEIFVTDADEESNDTVTLSLVGHVPTAFSLSGGALLGDGQMLDYEGEPADHQYWLTVQAVDSLDRGHQLTSTCIVVVRILPQNEYSPEWSNPIPDVTGHFPTLKIPESTGVGSPLLTLEAVDLDLGEGDLVYTLIAVRRANGKASDSPFTLDTKTGVLATSAILDRDVTTGGTEYYDLEVNVTDPGSLSAHGYLRVTLSDVNDNVPSIDHMDNVDITCSNVGDKISTIRVSDNDTTTGDYMYTIIFSERGVIALNETTGEFFLKNNFTEASESIVNVIVSVTEDDYRTTAVISFHFKTCNNTTISNNETNTSSLTTYTSEASTTTTLQVSSTSQSAPATDVKGADVEVWVLRGVAGVLGVLLLATYSVILSAYICRSTARVGHNQVSVSPVSTSSSVSECRTEITSVESLDYFQ